MPRMHPLCAALGIAATAAGVLSFAGEARAANPFVPFSCYGSPQYVNFHLASTSANDANPQNPSACSPSAWGSCAPFNYPNRADVRRQIFANQYVTKLGFRFDTFSTESGYDYVKLGNYVWGLGDYQDVSAQSGAPAVPFWKSVVPDPNAASFMHGPARVRFTTDGSVTGKGFAVGQASAECSGSFDNSPAAPLRRHERASGILLASKDVVYTQFPAGPDHATLALWGDAGNPGGTDFDLYARCNAYPSDTAFTARGFRSGSQELIHLDPGLCPAGSTWFVAVQSYSGAGMFNLTWAEHKAAQHIDVDVGLAYASDTGGGLIFAAAWNDYWRNTARAIFGATEGAMFIENIRNHGLKEPAQSDGRCGSPAVPCQGMVDLPGSGGQTRGTTNGGGRMSYVGQSAPPLTAVHEWGHKFWNLPDEYGGAPARALCGHTIMTAEIFIPHDFCYAGDHASDFDPATTAMTGSDMWTLMKGAGLTTWTPSFTTDAYDYLDFDFANLLGNVTNPS